MTRAQDSSESESLRPLLEMDYERSSPGTVPSPPRRQNGGPASVTVAAGMTRMSLVEISLLRRRWAAGPGLVWAAPRRTLEQAGVLEEALEARWRACGTAGKGEHDINPCSDCCSTCPGPASESATATMTVGSLRTAAVHL